MERSVAEWIKEAEENEGLSVGEWTEFIAAVKKEKKTSDEEFKKLSEVVQTRRELYRVQYNENLRINKENERLKANISKLQDELNDLDLGAITETIEGFKKRIEELNVLLGETLNVH